MNGRKHDPPKSAIWLLRHACPSDDIDALTGDLVERFREGQTSGWLWGQVLIAFAAGIPGAMRRHWPHFCYAIAGTVMIWFYSDAAVLRHAPGWFHWRELAWPWSQLAFELSRPALLALAALSVLAGGLAIERSFRWIFLLRTATINLALIAFGHFLPDMCPWLLRPAPGYNPFHMKMLIIPFPLLILLLFFSFLVAAWVGCSSPREAASMARPIERPAAL
jgi:hypothetical protein